MPKSTYTLIHRNSNSWVNLPDGSQLREVVSECGHRHRSIRTAIECRNNFKGTILAHLGKIEHNETRTEVSPDEIYQVELSTGESQERDDSDYVNLIEIAKNEWFARRSDVTEIDADETTHEAIGAELGLTPDGTFDAIDDLSDREIGIRVKRGLDNWMKEREQ